MMRRTRVVVATDGSNAAHRAIRWCADFAENADLDVVVVHVISNVGEWLMSVAQIDFQQIERERRELLKGPWTAPLRDAGVSFRTQLLVGDPIDAVLSAADEQDADLVVIGKTGHDRIGSSLLGGTAMKLAHRTKRPLLLIPDTPSQPDHGPA
jgi:nucleotide-binding universal stress UspA family protein